MDFAQFIIDLLLFLVYSLGVLFIITWWWRFWKLYVNQRYMNNLKWVMLEIKIPREINKNPMAMEIALNSFLQAGGISTFFDTEFLGKMPAYFSLEIASLEGVIHFYVRTEQKYRPLIEANLYSQYPGIEISETDDYTKLVRFEHNTDAAGFWGVKYKSAEKWKPYPGEKDKKDKDYEMPADFKPIKTYVDYGLDKDPKEEYKNDPITPVIEFLGSLGKGEYGWYQVIIQDSEGVFNKKFPKTYLDPKTHDRINLAEMAKKHKSILRKARVVKPGDDVFDQYGNPIQRTKVGEDGKATLETVKYGAAIGKEKEIIVKDSELTIEEKDEIDAINLKLSKPLLRAGIKLCYVVKKGTKFNSNNIPITTTILKAFTSKYNSIGICGTTDPYDYPWQDTMKKRMPWRKEEIFNEYVEREGFYPHLEKRDTLDKYEDLFFFPYKTYVRSMWRMFYEVIFHPFSHPEATKNICTLNLEEVASLWHFPGAVAQTPTLPRIDSTKGVAPVNLPM